MSFQTEYKFILPKGYIDPDGVVHNEGVMRLATAADEIFTTLMGDKVAPRRKFIEQNASLATLDI